MTKSVISVSYRDPRSERLTPIAAVTNSTEPATEGDRTTDLLERLKCSFPELTEEQIRAVLWGP